MVDIKSIITVKDIENPRFHISNLVCEILILGEKISKIEGNSFYYKIMKERKEDELIELKNKYVRVRREFNKTSLKELLIQRKQIIKKLNKIKRNNSGLAGEIAFTMVSTELQIIEDYIKMKSKFNKLKRLNDYSNIELYVFFEA